MTSSKLITGVGDEVLDIDDGFSDHLFDHQHPLPHDITAEH